MGTLTNRGSIMRTEIRAGDLVVVAKPTTCCKNDKTTGLILFVKAIRVHNAVCGHCSFQELKSVAETARGVYSLERLKIIHPDIGPEDTNTSEPTPIRAYVRPVEKI